MLHHLKVVNIIHICPATTDSCCQYQRDKINGTNLYNPGKGLENEVMKYVKIETARRKGANEMFAWPDAECEREF